VPRNSRPARTVDTPVTILYPLLLLFSTALAAAFCYLYLTKPVIIAAPAVPAMPALASGSALEPAIPDQPDAAGTPADPLALLPDADSLPGDQPGTPGTATPLDPRGLPATGSGIGMAYEETNLKVQHVLTAQGDGVDLGKIILDVPVMYETRRLRWTPADVQEARAVLIRLSSYQEKLRNLKAEGTFLLESWNQLMARSIPSQVVRADSPSLPENQGDALQPAKPDGPIQLQSPPAAE
jgi:hypothetical protein